MKLDSFHKYLISLLLVLAVCAAGVANARDFLDLHDSRSLHIDQADTHDASIDDGKHKQQILPVIIAAPYVFPLPETVVLFLSPTPVSFNHPPFYIARSFPSRASPV